MQPEILRWSNRFSTYFNGANQRVDIDKLATAMTTSTVGALSVWVRPVDGTPFGSKFILHFTKNQVAQHDYISLYNQSSGGLRFECIVGGSMQWRLQTNGFGFTNNNWVHLCAIQDGVEPVFYTNGKKTPQIFSVSTDKTKWFNDVGQPVSLGRIGCACSTSGGNFAHYNGDIDDVSVFNTPKTIGDFWDKSGKPTRLTGQRGMRGWLRMGDQDVHPIIRDHSANGNHGIMVNMDGNNFTRDVV
jgi:hypothetical protein